jgi:hypothetical protein
MKNISIKRLIMSTPLSRFNQLLCDFFDEMAETYPEENDIKQAAAALKTLKKMNPKLIHATFMETVHTEFKDPIMRSDEDYLVKRAHEILQSHYSDMAFAFWIFDKHWKTMSQTNKENVWKYCKALIVLAEKV